MKELKKATTESQFLVLHSKSSGPKKTCIYFISLIFNQKKIFLFKAAKKKL